MVTVRSVFVPATTWILAAPGAVEVVSAALVVASTRVTSHPVASSSGNSSAAAAVACLAIASTVSVLRSALEPLRWSLFLYCAEGSRRAQQAQRA
jgi:hypothetical protein